MAKTHRQNRTQLNGNRLQIYTRGDTGANWWQARTRDPNGSGYLTNILKTTDQVAAFSKADEWSDNLQSRIDQGLIIKLRSVDQACDIYIKELEEEIRRGDRPKRHLKDYKTLIERYLRPNFRQRKMDAFRQKDVVEFIRWRKNYSIGAPVSKVTTITYKRQQRNGLRTITRGLRQNHRAHLRALLGRLRLFCVGSSIPRCGMTQCLRQMYRRSRIQSAKLVHKNPPAGQHSLMLIINV